MNQNQNSRVISKIIQPGLLGLWMVRSTLAPLFATAFATHNSHIAFLVGLSAATGAGISMAFAEGLFRRWRGTGRGHPLMRRQYCWRYDFFGRHFSHSAVLTFQFANRALPCLFYCWDRMIAIAFIRFYYLKTSFWLFLPPGNCRRNFGILSRIFYWAGINKNLYEHQLHRKL